MRCKLINGFRNGPRMQLRHPKPAASLVALVPLAVFALALTGHTGEIRNWSSTSGTYKIDAELVKLKEDGTVVLKTKSGKVIEVPIGKLSEADQKYARSQAAGTSPPKAASEPPKSPDEVEAEAQQCRTAKEAVMIYKFYLARPNLTGPQRATAEASLESWKKKADEDQVRLGKQWMTKTEAAKIRKQAESKIEQAVEFLRLQNEQLAKQNLEEASRLDPDSIQADFLMGVVYGAIAKNDKKAQQHFEKCLKREPDNVSVLNNLAVSLAAQKKYSEAAKHWKTAAGKAPKMRALSQNIGSLIALAGKNEAKIPSKTLNDLSQVYEELITKYNNPRPTQVAFIYTPPYGAGWEEGKGKGEGKPQKEAVVVGSGSGFVVHPHIILTNRHVVERASGLLVLNPQNPKGEPLAAELIAIADGLDLALIRCDKLDAPAVPLVETLPPRGSDIMVLGYPLGPEFGTTLKSTRGSMVAMPDASVDNMCLYDAITNPGNSGGPLCDKKARVAAVVRAVTGSVGGSYGAAIPIGNAMPFLRSHIPGLAASSIEAAELDWPGVDAKVAPSTVLILKKENLRTDLGVGGKR
jgi:S1-C subfamily serine protease